MIFYIVLLIALIILYVLLKNRKFFKTNAFCLLSFLILLFFYTVRDVTVGWDTFGYVDIFKRASQIMPLESYLEPGWIFLIKAIYSIKHGWSFYFLCIGLIGIGFYFIGVEKISPMPTLSILLFYAMGNYFNLMNQVRCQMAVCICLLSFSFLWAKKYILSLIVVLLAYLIHESALIFLIFILFDVMIKKYNNKMYAIVISGILFVFMNYDRMYWFITRFYYTSYTENSRLIRETGSGNLKMFIIFTVFLISSVYIDRLNASPNTSNLSSHEDSDVANSQERLRKLLFTAVLFALALQFISLKNAMIARFANYFSVYYTILIPFELSRMRNRRIKQQYTVAIFLLFIAYMIIYLRFSENGFGRDGVIPYAIHTDW